MSFSTLTDRYMPVVAFILAALALIVSVAQFLGYGKDVSSFYPEEAAVQADPSSHHAAVPGGGPGMMPGGMPGMRPGGGMMRGGGPGMGMGRPADPAVIDLLEKRIGLLRERLAFVRTAVRDGRLPEAELARAGYALDEALLLRRRAEGGRMMAGASELFLKSRLASVLEQAGKAALAAGKISPDEYNSLQLEANKAELDYLQALGRLRNRDAFLPAAESLKDYPSGRTEDRIHALYDAETMR